jgi:hypothetical protein
VRASEAKEFLPVMVAKLVGAGVEVRG